MAKILHNTYNIFISQLWLTVKNFYESCSRLSSRICLLVQFVAESSGRQSTMVKSSIACTASYTSGHFQSATHYSVLLKLSFKVLWLLWTIFNHFKLFSLTSILHSVRWDWKIRGVILFYSEFQVRECTLHRNGFSAATTMEIRPRFGALEFCFTQWFAATFPLKLTNKFAQPGWNSAEDFH